MADQEYETAADRLKAEADAANQAAVDAREESQPQPETNEEYYARIEGARATGIFGDTPTDPTTGDVDVPSSDEEGAGVNVAEVDVAADEGDGEAQETSPEEAKRQDDAPAQEAQDEATANDENSPEETSDEASNDAAVE